MTAIMYIRCEDQQMGLGVGFLPRHRIAHLLADNTFVEVSVEKGTVDTPIHVAWKMNNKGRALRWFIDAIMNAFIATEIV
jgi:DNA-binding transcriptional LysR family regulator